MKKLFLVLFLFVSNFVIGMDKAEEVILATAAEVEAAKRPRGGPMARFEEDIGAQAGAAARKSRKKQPAREYVEQQAGCQTLADLVAQQNKTFTQLNKTFEQLCQVLNVQNAVLARLQASSEFPGLGISERGEDIGDLARILLLLEVARAGGGLKKGQIRKIWEREAGRRNQNVEMLLTGLIAKYFGQKNGLFNSHNFDDPRESFSDGEVSAGSETRQRLFSEIHARRVCRAAKDAQQGPAGLFDRFGESRGRSDKPRSVRFDLDDKPASSPAAFGQ